MNWTDLIDDDIYNLLNYLNSCLPEIKFSVENSKKLIHFLDLKIGISRNKFEFNIYLKSTTMDLTILNDSNHPKAHKYALFHSMLIRVRNILMSVSNFDHEINIIRQIALHNGYSLAEINRLIRSL